MTKEYLRDGPYDVMAVAHAALSDAPIVSSFFGLLRAAVFPIIGDFNDLYIGDVAATEFLLKLRSTPRMTSVLIPEALVFQSRPPQAEYASSKSVPDDWFSR